MACKQLCICGASGAGKSTLVKRLMAEFPNAFAFSVSHTTRKPRQGEVDGVHYHFVDKASIEKEIEEGKFLEHAVVHENVYGTSVAAVRAIQDSGRICILDVDVQGAKSIKKKESEFGLKPRYLFVQPPSLEVLRERLVGRGTESAESLSVRLANAAKEMAEAPMFDHVIVNDDLDTAYAELRGVLLPDINALA